MKFDSNFKEIKIRQILIMFLIALLISIPITLVLSINGEISNTNVNKLSLLIEFLFLSIITFKLKPSKENMKLLYVDFKNNLNIKEIIWIVLFVTCLEIGTSNILIDIAYIIGPNFANWFINNSSVVINSITDYWMIFAMTVFFTPFIDEIMFRNILFKRISKKSNIYVGLIVSSIIFASLNFGNEMIGLFLLGIVNCMLYVKYENILMPMLIDCADSIIHMLKFVLFGKYGNEVVVLTFKDMILYATSGLTLCIIGIIFFVKFIKDNKIYLRKSFNESKNANIN